MSHIHTVHTYNSSKRQHSLLILCIIIITSLQACTDKDSSLTSVTKESSTTFELPDEVMVYGGLDHVQQWLLNSQSYAQTAYSNTPSFAMMLPLLFAQQIGLKNPQALDLTAAMRWFAIPKSHDSELSLSTKAIVDRWDSLILFKLKPTVKKNDLVNQQLWQKLPGKDYTFNSKLPDQPGVLYLRDSYLILCSQKEQCEQHYTQLIQYAEFMSLKDFTVAMRPQNLPIQKWIDSLKSQNSKNSELGLTQLLSQLQDVDTFKVMIQSQAKHIALEVQIDLGDDQVLQDDMAYYTTNAHDSLARIPAQTRGLISVYPAPFIYIWKLIKQQQMILEQLKYSSPDPMQTWLKKQLQEASLDIWSQHLSTFFVDPKLQLSALIKGDAKQLQPLMHQLLTYLKTQLESGEWLNTKIKPKQSNDPLRVTLNQNQTLHTFPMETLTLLNPPRKQSQPQLQDLEVQLSEVRALYTPHVTWLGFGPKSQSKVDQLYQLHQVNQGKNSLHNNPGLSDLNHALSRLIFLFYLTPQVIEDTMQQTLKVKAINHKPTQTLQAAMTLVVAAHNAQNYFVRWTIPVGIAQRLSTAFHLFKALMKPTSKSVPTQAPTQPVTPH
jgi:hypothetical protein